jgi:hypothetical protein
MEAGELDLLVFKSPAASGVENHFCFARKAVVIRVAGPRNLAWLVGSAFAHRSGTSGVRRWSRTSPAQGGPACLYRNPPWSP